MNQILYIQKTFSGETVAWCHMCDTHFPVDFIKLDVTFFLNIHEELHKRYGLRSPNTKKVPSYSQVHTLVFDELLTEK